MWRVKFKFNHLKYYKLKYPNIKLALELNFFSLLFTFIKTILIEKKLFKLQIYILLVSLKLSVLLAYLLRMTVIKGFLKQYT